MPIVYMLYVSSFSDFEWHEQPGGSWTIAMPTLVTELIERKTRFFNPSSRAICIRTTKHAEAEETLPNHSNSAFIRTVMQRRKEGMQSNAHLIPHESPNS
ncbi:uncharacterized protein PGTG_14138 [Puccinia graminis f. sp. tritici CRL 75-36-700-3]|uniref:Uncharacterized protein n=1 Tax=Puccinia graminis f. sp. tritici (strain CRL 75-36-700-3 / race SCCL) TaxID=418459 RepID=E3KX29_PUCGT|nr:uncharacterized protein PGTG_14138 [Puccinia graminis f. sp. tritici CRL 75-36-700-3]EFP88799.1 hypothetical protein PGTG_14138 [Puccinia graminis f. sp. tritici CRL 75-36-700-3]